jgi:hypothetical protein
VVRLRALGLRRADGAAGLVRVGDRSPAVARVEVVVVDVVDDEICPGVGDARPVGCLDRLVGAGSGVRSAGALAPGLGSGVGVTVCSARATLVNAIVTASIVVTVFRRTNPIRSCIALRFTAPS